MSAGRRGLLCQVLASVAGSEFPGLFFTGDLAERNDFACVRQPTDQTSRFHYLGSLTLHLHEFMYEAEPIPHNHLEVIS